jgi:hypothetical protein
MATADVPADVVIACGASIADIIKYGAPLALLFVAWTILYIKSQGKALVHAATEKAFNTVDIDQSGSVDSKELEVAVTILYAEINKYVRVKRPSRQDIQEYVDKIDVDRDGALDRAEFNVVMTLLCQNVAFRAGLMLAVKLGSPFMAGTLVDAFEWAAAEAGEFRWVERVFGGDGCAFAVASKLLPFVDQAMVETMVALGLVSVVVPAIFDWWDDVVLAHADGAAKTSRKPSADATGPLAPTAAGAATAEAPHANALAKARTRLPVAPLVDAASSMGFVGAGVSMAVAVAAVLLAKHLLTCRPGFDSGVVSPRSVEE